MTPNEKQRQAMEDRDPRKFTEYGGMVFPVPVIINQYNDSRIACERGGTGTDVRSAKAGGCLQNTMTAVPTGIVGADTRLAKAGGCLHTIEAQEDLMG